MSASRLLLVACAALLTTTARGERVCVGKTFGELNASPVHMIIAQVIDSMQGKITLGTRSCGDLEHIGTFVSVCDNAPPIIEFESLIEAHVNRTGSVYPPALAEAYVYCTDPWASPPGDPWALPVNGPGTFSSVKPGLLPPDDSWTLSPDELWTLRPDF